MNQSERIGFIALPPLPPTRLFSPARPYRSSSNMMQSCPAAAFRRFKSNDKLVKTETKFRTSDSFKNKCTLDTSRRKTQVNDISWKNLLKSVRNQHVFINTVLNTNLSTHPRMQRCFVFLQFVKLLMTWWVDNYDVDLLMKRWLLMCLSRWWLLHEREYVGAFDRHTSINTTNRQYHLSYDVWECGVDNGTE